MAQIFLAIIHIFLHTVSSQSVCIWGSEGVYSFVNGQYIASGTYGGKTKYSKSTPDNCPHGIMYIYWNIEFEAWDIFDVIDPYAYPYAICDSPSLSDCNVWTFYDLSDPYSYDLSIDSSLSASFGSCPDHIWQCDTVHIPSLPSPCNTVFDNHISDNLWTDSSTTYYWYFDEGSFAWKCDDELPSTCGTSPIAWSRGWNYIENGQSSELLFDHPWNLYTVNCIMNPTTTTFTTQNPIPTTSRSPTPKPTQNPIPTTTRLPSSAPTDAPLSTHTPSHIPTIMPSFTPTLIPSDDLTFTSSSLQSRKPTIAPVTFPKISIKSPTANKPTKVAEGMVDEKTTTMKTQWIPPDDDDDIKKNKSHFLTLLLVGAVVVGVCLFCLVIMCVYNHKQSQSKDGQIHKNMVHVFHVNNAPVHVANDVVKNIQLPMRDRIYTDSRYMENEDDDANHAEVAEEPGSNQIHLGIFHETNGSSLSWDSTPSDPKAVTVGDDIANEPELNTSGGSHEIDFNGLIGGAVTEGADEQIIRNELNKKERELLKVWLTNKVRLPQYYGVLIENGYETLSIVKEITKEEELNEIGIVLKGHVKKLMAEIKILRNYVE